MFRCSPAKWEQLRAIQEDIVKKNLGGAKDLPEESEDDVDNMGEGAAEAIEGLQVKILRPKIDVVTRWNSVWAML